MKKTVKDCVCFAIILFVLCYIGYSFTNPAPEKIKSAFGLTLGEQLDPSCVIDVDKKSFREEYHKFTPLLHKRSPMFDEYYVSTTIKTHKVVSIYAIKYYKGIEYEDIAPTIVALRYMLWKKYGVEDEFSKSRDEISQGKRRVSLYVSHAYYDNKDAIKLSICYFDGNLVRLRDREREEFLKEKDQQELEKDCKRLNMRGL